MGCAIDRPCGNVLRFFVRRPDGVEVHHCLQAHSFLVGEPVARRIEPPTHSERGCYAGDACRGNGLIEWNRKAVYCLPCESVADTHPGGGRRRPPKVAGCQFCDRSQFGPCTAHGGPSNSERALRAYYVKVGKPYPYETGERCRWCQTSTANGRGPCVRHGGLPTYERRLQANRERRRTRVRPRPSQAITLKRPSVKVPHYA